MRTEVAIFQPGLLRGSVAAVPSKSAAHRHLICAALSSEPTKLSIDALNEDIRATMRCLTELGADIQWDGMTLSIRPVWGNVPESATLDCGESGSTLRFLLPLAAALGVSARFAASGRLPERPNAALIGQLRAHGAAIDREAPPLTVQGKLRGGIYELPGNVTSQYATGLLHALPFLDVDSEIRIETPIESEDYLRLTASILEQYGIRAERVETGYIVPGGQSYHSGGASAIEGDWSNAAFWLAANAVGSDVAVTGLDDASAQGDRTVADILSQFQSGGVLRGIRIDATNVPDLVPILAVVATQAKGETRIENAARLRIKECDRLAAMRENLAALGADIRETEDSLVIRGGAPLRGGTVSSFNDHRVAMAMAIAASVAKEPVTLQDAGAVSKSYPGFYRDYRALGGIVDGEHIRDEA